jgi:ribosomal protein L10
MSKSRKEKLAEELKQVIEDAENLLINTPENVTAGEYQQTIERIKYLRETLKNVLKM